MSESHKRLKSFTKSFIIYGLAAALSRFIGLLLTPIYTRIFNPQDYGAIDVLNVFIYFAVILAATEIWAGVSRDYISAENDIQFKKELISTGLIHIIICNIVVMLIAYLFSSYILNFLEIGEEFRSSFLLIISVIPSAALFSYFNVLMRFEKKPWLFFTGILAQLTINAGVTLYLIIVVNSGIIGFFWGQLFGNTAGIIVFILAMYKYFKFKYSIPLLRKLLRFSLPVIPAVIAVWLNTYANRIVMLKYLSMNDIGIYSVALKLASIFLFLEYALRLAWTPLFYELAEGSNLINELYSVFRVMIKGLFVLFISVSLYTKELVSILAPKEYSEAESIASFLCLPVLLMIFNLVLCAGPLIARKTFLDSLSQISGMALNLGTMFFTIPIMGIKGAAISYFTGSLLTSLMYLYFSNRLIGLKIPLILFLIALSIMSGFSFTISNYHLSIFYKLGFTVLVLIPSFYFMLIKDKDVHPVYVKIISKLKISLNY